MYKIIIVDDEILTLDQLSVIPDWSSLGFELAGKFSSGEAAIEYIKQNYVDAILTDVKMESVSGLELAKFCYDNYPHIQIALISAYRDFEYARTAIKYDVCAYLTKPITYSELNSVLKKLHEHIKSAEAKKFFINEEISFKKRQLIFDCITKITYNTEKIEKELSLAGNNIRANTSKCAFIRFHIEGYDDYIPHVWHYENDRLYDAINQLTEAYGSENDFTMVCYNKAYIDIIAFCTSETQTAAEFENDCSNFFNTLSDNCKNIMEMNISKDFIKVFTNIQKMRSNIHDAANSLKLEGTENGDEFSDKTVEKAIAYMKENLSKNISLNDVADYICMNSSYLSVYFKQHTGEKFIDFLTRLRMNEAKRLLKTTDLKIEVISDKIGYCNTSHFYKIFKLYTGLTPIKYKNISDD